MVKHKPSSQSPMEKSMKGTVQFATGSGSRPMGSKMKTESSAPKNAQNIRGGKNC